MANFKSWQEVEDYLSIDCNVVNTPNWSFTKGYMCCSEPGCCDSWFNNVSECLEYIKSTVDLDSVEKCE